MDVHLIDGTYELFRFPGGYSLCVSTDFLDRILGSH
jgi:hypothetical protein